MHENGGSSKEAADRSRQGEMDPLFPVFNPPFPCIQLLFDGCRGRDGVNALVELGQV